MEFSQYLRLLRKWSWLLLLAAFVGGGVNFVFSSQAVPYYSAMSMISIGTYIDSPNPDSMQINISNYLVDTYAQLARSYNVMQGVVENLNLPISPEGLSGSIRTEVIDRTPLLRIYATYGDPVLATDIANETARQLVLQSPTNLTADQQAALTFYNQQIDALNEQVNQLRLQIGAIDAELAAPTSNTDPVRLADQRSNIIDQINQSTLTISNFAGSAAELQRRTNAIEIVERARSSALITPRGSLNSGLMGAIAGFVLAFVFALAVEYIDDTIRTTETAVTTLGLPVFGTIMRFGKKSDRYADRLLARLPPMSPVSEAYRNLRTNLLYNTKENSTEKPIYIVTSPGPEEGKSLTSANLAITLSLAGLRVLLIDADLRRPKVHEVFGLENQVGLTTLLFADPTAQGEDAGAVATKLRQCLQDTFVPELRAITSGFTPSNPSELLGSTLMKHWVDIFRKAQNVDAIVIDTPPCLVVADSAVLAATIDANVILVLNSEKTRRAAAQRAKQQFEQLGVKISGLVLNQVNPREETYGYGYNSYYYYSPSETGVAAPRGLRRLFANRSKQS